MMLNLIRQQYPLEFDARIIENARLTAITNSRMRVNTGSGERQFDENLICATSEIDTYVFSTKEQSIFANSLELGHPLSSYPKATGLLDVIMSNVICATIKPRYSYELCWEYSGGTKERAQQRADYIVNNILSHSTRLISELTYAAMYGVSVLQAEILARHSIPKRLFDFDSTLSKHHDLVIEEPMDPYLLSPRPSFIVATGMTIATGYMEKLLQYAKATGTPLYFYCNSATCVAKHLLALGASGVFVEEYPFYISNSCTKISWFTN